LGGAEPRDVADLWAFVVEIDHDSRMALFAHGLR
jgi:ParB family chromosome partitioning protein